MGNNNATYISFKRLYILEWENLLSVIQYRQTIRKQNCRLFCMSLLIHTFTCKMKCLYYINVLYESIDMLHFNEFRLVTGISREV